jgi:serine O-acetyltransferase
MGEPERSGAQCEVAFEVNETYLDQIPGVVERIVGTCSKDEPANHVGSSAIPSKAAVINLITQMENILYPGYFGHQELDFRNLAFYIGQQVNTVFQALALEIARSIRHECRRLNSLCVHCIDLGQKQALEFLSHIPEMRQALSEDVVAAYLGDPAAKSYAEIVFCYPGLMAITVYRMAHQLYVQDVPLLPRIMTEYAHSLTGIDIHPGATVGRRFFIDHGTGIVVGETTDIGDNVRIYQGVTLGALSVPADRIEDLRGRVKRHPTIEDDVTIYAGATILGSCVIGKGSIIGGNVWVTESVPPGSKVLISPPRHHVTQRSGERS